MKRVYRTAFRVVDGKVEFSWVGASKDKSREAICPEGVEFWSKKSRDHAAQELYTAGGWEFVEVEIDEADTL